jgi:hypothetical protein
MSDQSSATFLKARFHHTDASTSCVFFEFGRVAAASITHPADYIMARLLHSP